MNKKLIKEIAMITIGVAIAVCGLKIFLVPNKIAAGGISGVATILYYLFKLPIGAVYIVLNIPLFVFGIKDIGRAFGLKTLYATVLYSVLAEVIYVKDFQSDLFLACVYGGILTGIGIGLVVKYGATTGGSDMAAKILNNRFKHIGVSTFIFIVDFIVIFASGVVFSPTLAMYAIASLYLTAKVMELLLEGLNRAKAFLIITDKTKEVSEMILYKLNRGATLLNGKGMYTGQDRPLILCIVERMAEVEQLKHEIQIIDEKAFIIATDVKEVLGEGFSKD
jgi:uncharacterized membrane-anchored protein YitT (DUF2179 family)